MAEVTVQSGTALVPPKFKSHYDNLIGGKWVAPVKGEYFENISPVDGKVFTQIARSTAEDVELALDAAHVAAPHWNNTSATERSNILLKIADVMEQNLETLARVETWDNGKPIRETRAADMPLAIDHFRYFAGVIRSDEGSVAELDSSTVSLNVHEPLGVVAQIIPWNFPLLMAAWKIAPALAYGNAVVFKPSEVAPGCAWALADMLDRAGLPAGVFNMVIGKGSSVGEAMVHHPDIAGISFTGSIATGKRIAAGCVARQARVQLEMGGKNPMIVLDDADLTTAVNCSANGAFFSTGQRCTASSRLIVTEGIHDRFVRALEENMKALKVDHALKEGTQIGPVIDERQLQKNLFYLGVAREEGAVVRGGEILKRDSDGYFMAPALFTETRNDMRINREEIFGPTASVIRVKNYEEALAVANDTEFGLSSGICTTSLKYARHFQRHAQAGMVMVNLPTAGVDYHVPFGGRKGSSYGTREQGKYAAEFYTIVKTAYVAG